MGAGDHVENLYLPLNLAENLKLLYRTILHTHTHTHTHSHRMRRLTRMRIVIGKFRSGSL